MAQKPDAKPEGAEPRLLRALLELAQFGPKMGAFARCEKLGEAKAAYVEIYPETGHGKWKLVNASRNMRAPSFAAFVTSKGWGSKSTVKIYVSIYEKLTPESRASLRLGDYGAKLTHLRALSKLSPKAQARALELMDTGRAVHLFEAVERASDKMPRASRLRPREKRLLAAIPSAALAAELRVRGWYVKEGGGDG